MVFVHADGKPESPADEIKWQTIESFHTFPNGRWNGIFASPEPGRISDASAVVKSILSGRRLARAVHQHFTDGLITPIENLTCEADYVLNITELHHVSPSERQQPTLLDVEGDSKTAWIFPKEFPGLDETAARKEAERCLQCGLICYEKTGVKEPEKNDA
jgi:formate dehydrogenase beta subunit